MLVANCVIAEVITERGHRDEKNVFQLAGYGSGGPTVTVAMLVTLASCAVGKSVPLDVTKGTVIQNVTVANTRDGSLLPGMTIVIDQGKIQRITPMPICASGTAQAINASGKYAVPGFLDMHAHVVAGADLPITRAWRIPARHARLSSPFVFVQIESSQYRTFP